MMTVDTAWFNSSGEITTHGRVLAVSAPVAGSSRTRNTLNRSVTIPIPSRQTCCTDRNFLFARRCLLSAARVIYCRPIGTHERMTEVLLTRARETVERAPFPHAPGLKELTLFIAGHGTEQDPNSRKPVERQVERIRDLGLYAAVHTVFLEEEPRIGECYRIAQTRNIVVVPFFIGDGPHVREDIPVMLGEPSRVVRQRIESGQPAWRNPTEP